MHLIHRIRAHQAALLDRLIRKWLPQLHFQRSKVRASDLICPTFGDVLFDYEGALESCSGERYPVIGGVAIVVRGVRIDPQGQLFPLNVVDQLIDAIALRPALRRTIQQIFNHKFYFAEAWMQTEADQFLHRIAAEHEGLRCALGLESDSAAISYEININPSPLLSSIFNISHVQPGARFSVNIRLVNAGVSTLSSDGANPMMLSYHWLGPDGVKVEGIRTPLLDDLLPDREVSVPVFIVAPSEVGSYTLQIRALREGVAWFEQSSVLYDIKVDKGKATVDDPVWIRTGKQYDYMGDHFEAVRLLKHWSSCYFNRPVEKVVELGGNAHPMIHYFDAPYRYNVDIDPFGVIIGNLVRGGGNNAVKFIIADGMALPMRPNSIDMLVLFATFHHFPDPIGLLSRLRHSVAADGLICLMCEPIGHVHRDYLPEEYLSEIRKGVNEQSFELWEYQQMFSVAGLEVVDAQIDVGSAKFALRRKSVADNVTELEAE